MMQRPNPTIKVQSPSQVEESMREKQARKIFDCSTYAGLNRVPQLVDITPPVEFYEANGDISNMTLYYTAADETPSYKWTTQVYKSL